MQANIILASQSKQRQAILKTLNLAFKVMPAEIDEQAIQAKNVSLRAKKIARAKAEFVAQKHPQAIVMAADTFCVFKDKIMEKPSDLDEAREMLKALSGNQLFTYTGFAYLDQKNKIDFATTKKIKIKFRPLTEEEIETYVQNEPVLAWSAAFCPAYPAGAALVASISGSFTAFTHGLPMEEVTKFLRKSGVYEE
ncbi:MAG: nucleoside triphosphate pyrophosphatase [Candidatus Woesebacteria bacterium]|jgi:septum formation protein